MCVVVVVGFFFGGGGGGGGGVYMGNKNKFYCPFDIIASKIPVHHTLNYCLRGNILGGATLVPPTK